MKKKSIVIVLACAVAMIASTSVITYATNKAQMQQAPNVFTTENVQAVNSLAERVNKYIENKVQQTRAGSRQLNVPLVKQSNYYYCGPASTRMTLKYLGIDRSQSQLASEMGTNSSQGTYVYRITNCLNNRLGAGTYRHVLLSQVDFPSGLIYSLDKGKPIICQVQTSELPVYNGHEAIHFVVATGYLYAQSGGNAVSDVTYNDPNNDSRFYGTHTAKFAEMRDAIDAYSDFYIMSN